MERSGTYRQQAISTANLLREAADRLETSSSDDRHRSNLTSLSAGSSRAPTTSSIVTASQRPSTSNIGGVTQCLTHYGNQPFTLDERMDLDISFERKTMCTPVYIT